MRGFCAAHPPISPAGDPRRRVRLVEVDFVGVSVMAIPLGLLGFRPEAWFLATAAVLGGAGIEIFGTGWRTALMEQVPHRKRRATRARPCPLRHRQPAVDRSRRRARPDRPLPTPRAPRRADRRPHRHAPRRGPGRPTPRAGPRSRPPHRSSLPRERPHALPPPRVRPRLAHPARRPRPGHDRAVPHLGPHALPDRSDRPPPRARRHHQLARPARPRHRRPAPRHRRRLPQPRTRHHRHLQPREPRPRCATAPTTAARERANCASAPPSNSPSSTLPWANKRTRPQPARGLPRRTPRPSPTPQNGARPT